MELNEAYNKANIGDIIKCGGYQFEKGGHEKSYAVGLKKALSGDWEIIPAEPKVLTIGELIEKQLIPEEIKSTSEHAWNLHSLATIFYEEGNKKGRLEEWLNHKKLREAVECFRKQFSGYFSGSEIGKWRIIFDKAFENLKPLNQK